MTSFLDLNMIKSTRIEGDQVILVPYTPLHVPKYHNWMQSPELQHFTGSEPLTLDQEFEMQIKWVLDKDKVTFIVLDKQIWETTNDEVSAMIGDTNIFFGQADDYSTGEIEIMIAEMSQRKKGKGKEAVQLMMRFGFEQLHIKRFEAKIKMDNPGSLKMFKSLGFKQISESQVFQEITLELDNSAIVLEKTNKAKFVRI